MLRAPAGGTSRPSCSPTMTAVGTRLLLPSRRRVTRWRLESVSTSDAPHVPGRASPARDDTVVFAARAFPVDPGFGVDERMNHPAAGAAEWTAATSDVYPDDLLWLHRADGCHDRPEVIDKASRAARQLGKPTGVVAEIPKVSDPGVRHGYAQGELQARAALPAPCFRVASGAVHPILWVSRSA